ncbi:hypothetical protein [Parafrankia discariae]|uniref:hypothetical protein n=1 Tax=Parafrankia discariae TaxID=365528 RepID=UPI00035CD101|nr:hypothetical protein [Parafrankia discariae]
MTRRPPEVAPATPRPATARRSLTVTGWVGALAVSLIASSSPGTPQTPPRRPVPIP